MVKALYYNHDGLLYLNVTGHAMSADKGDDLVCAGVSMLMYALSNAVSGFTIDKWVKPIVVQVIDEGNVTIAVTPHKKYLKHCRVAFGMAFGGIQMLAAQFPENVEWAVLDQPPDTE